MQGLLEVMSVSGESDSVTSRPISASFIPFRREAQEANHIDRLRQTAGPAAIDSVVRHLIQAAYAPTLSCGKYRQVDVRNLLTPVDYLSTKSLSMFVELYIDVIKHDLGKLGYRLFPAHRMFCESIVATDCYESVVLEACSSESTETFLESNMSCATSLGKFAQQAHM